MKKLISVVFLVLFSLPTYALSLASTVDAIEKEWALIYYGHTQPDPSAAYQKLFAQAQVLAQQFPAQAEPLLWQAILVATDANHQSPLKALEEINLAQDLLLRAITLDPNGVGGAAQVTLGTLYYLAPPWPLAFGDNDQAEKYFLAALKINADSIEANYFYGDFLLTQNKAAQAEPYFKKAIALPARKQQPFADKSLQQQAVLALNNANEHTAHRTTKILLSHFSDTEAH